MYVQFYVFKFEIIFICRNEAEFQLQTTKTLARKELLTPDQGDDKDVISDAVLKTKTANDKEADLR